MSGCIKFPADAPAGEYVASLVDLAAALGRTQPAMTQWTKRKDWPFGPHVRGKKYHVPTVKKWSEKLRTPRTLGSVVVDESDADLAAEATTRAVMDRVASEDAGHGDDADPDPSDIATRLREAKYRKLTAECATITVKKLILEGRYISRETVEQQWREWALAVKARFERLPREFAKRYKLPTDKEQALDHEVRHRLKAIAEEARGKSIEVDGGDAGGDDRASSADDTG